MNNIIGGFLIPGYLLLVISGWGLFGFAYYRLQRHQSISQSMYRGLLTLFLGFLIGMPLSDSAAMTGDKSIGARTLQSLSYAWWIAPYLVAATIVVMNKLEARENRAANKAL
jgi:hypothetical protein